jgi:hypothetical protein
MSKEYDNGECAEAPGTGTRVDEVACWLLAAGLVQCIRQG